MSGHTVAIGGGKGGVGKSIVSANLAIAIAQKGRRVLLVDADLGGANLHTFFGIDRPKVLLEHFISRKIENLGEAVLPTSQQGLSLICGGMPVLGTANPKYGQKLRLIRHLDKLDADVVILDTGAGSGFNVLDLFNACEHKIVVFTPQLTSLHNGYGFIKAAIHRNLFLALDKRTRSLLTSTDPEAGGENLDKVIARIGKEYPEQAEKASLIVAEQNMYVVGNMLNSAKDRHIVSAVTSIAKDHLQIDAPVLGNIKMDERIARSVNERRPFMLWANTELNAEAFRAMSQKLLSVIYASSRPPKFAFSPQPRDPNLNAFRQQRNEPRFPTRRISAGVVVGGKRIGCRVLNVAHGGVMLQFDTSPVKPASGTLEMSLTGGSRKVDVEIQERHRENDGVRIGFSFKGIDGKTRQAITEIVSIAIASTVIRKTHPPGDLLKNSG